MGKLRSGRVKRLPQSGITSDRYQFLGLEQAEPDLGDPLVGVSSVGVKPYTGAISDLYVVTSSGSGERYWTKQSTIIQNGITNQGSITVRNKGAVVGNANQITDVNFVGNGVTVISPASWWTGGPGTGYSSVDVQITVTDIAVSGNTGSVPYRASTGFLVGSTDLIYSPSNNYVGIGSTVPTVKLDVLGDVKVSGTTTTLNATITKLTIPTTGSIGIGTTNAIANLDVRGTVNIAGIATITTLVATSASLTNLNSNGISTIGFLTATNAYIGILTVGTTLNSLNNSWFSGNIGVGTISPQRRIDVVGSAATDPSQVAIRLLNTNTTGFGAYISLNASSIGRDYRIVSTGVSEGIGTGRFSIYDVAANAHRVVIGTAGSVGIGTTNPQYALDINGPVGINSILYVKGFSGNQGQVLQSNGPNAAVSWENSAGSAGVAGSITITNTLTTSTYYPTFTEQSVTGNAGIIRVNSTGLVFNPGTTTLGIGTTNVSSGVNTSYNLVARTSNITGFATFAAVQVSGIATFTNQLDLRGNVSVATTITIGSQNQLTSGILTSTTTSAQTVDSFSSSSIRSAKYNIQVTTTGQLVSSASTSPSPSVTSLGGGNNYVSGNYTNVALSTVTGSGTDAYADISIAPETILTLNSITFIGEDAFFSSSEISPSPALRLYEPIIFNKAVSASAAQNSKVTSIKVTNPGSGYTSIPTIGIATPTNNPFINGVTGIGSTATATVSSMVITDVTINTPGIHTAIVPTIRFNTPIGIGSTALGVVGFGISSVKVNSPGFGYTSIPITIITGIAVTAATAGISSIFITNIELTSTGIGYTGSSGGGNYPVITIDSPTSGTTAIATVSSLGISTIFNITTGIGYTVPPILTVAPPTSGVNTATIQSSLGIGTFIITNPGAGYTASPLITLNPSPTNFDYVVGLGITSTETVITNPGSGYINITYTRDCISVGGVGTGAQVNLIFNGGGLADVLIVNSGYGYTVAPTVDFSGISPGSGAAVKLGLKVTDVKIINPGYGNLVVPTASIIPKAGQPGAGASLTASMGIGGVTVTGFGSGYTTNPAITITPPPVGFGSGASVIAGLGVTTSNITITNAGVGYTTIIPKVRISPPVGVGTSATGNIGVGITRITVTSPGYGYSGTLPLVSVPFSSGSSGSGLSLGISSIVVTNIFVTSPGAGYTAADLGIATIATYNPVGTISTVGFGVSTIDITYSGIGYTTAASAAITFSKPSIGINTTTASATLGYPGVIPGPGYGITTQIYYIAALPTPNTIKLCTGISGGVGIGTLTSVDVSGGSVVGGNFSDVSYFAGGSVSNVNIVSPGSGYTATSRLTATNFDGGNVGYGFSFVTGSVVNNYQISDVMVLNNVGAFSTTPDFIEYGTLANNEILGAFSADLSGSNVRLLFTPTYNNNTIKVNKNYTTI